MSLKNANLNYMYNNKLKLSENASFPKIKSTIQSSTNKYMPGKLSTVFLKNQGQSLNYTNLMKKNAHDLDSKLVERVI